ncbi:Vesicle-mediated ER to Golgi transport protein [Oleoguttula sp. CCFEE 5521]
MTSGTSAVLLGTIYEFSTKDSPIPRRTLAPLLTQKLTRAKYLAALQTLRQDPAIRDFDLYPTDAAANGLDATFVDLFQTEYSRLRKAIDKDPGLEVIPSSASEAGVDRDVLDELRQQITGLSTALAAAQQNAQDSTQAAEQERLGLQKEAQTASAEVERLRRINQAMQAGHEEDSQRSVAQKAAELEALNLAHSRTLAGLRQDAEKSARSAREQAEQAAQLQIQELERRLVELGNAHRTEQSGHESKSRELEALTTQHSALQRNAQQTNIHFQTLQTRNTELNTALQQERSRAETVTAQLERTSQAHAKSTAYITRAEEALEEVREELQGRDAELATERAGFADLEAELESHKTSLATAQKDLAASKTAVSASPVAAGAAATLKKELEAAKEAEKAAKEELESMLLVLADIETERDDFKAKVKELGGDVGSEGSDADEEAGEGDDEDVEDEADNEAANAKKAEDSDVD